jgi:hypothetical protein
MVLLADSDRSHDLVVPASLLENSLLRSSDDERVGVVPRDRPGERRAFGCQGSESVRMD